MGSRNVNTALPRNDHGNALHALANRARHASQRALVFLEAAGFALGLLIYWLAPTRWLLIFPCLAFGLLGLWGILDHQIARYRRRSRTRRLLRAIQSTIALAGIVVAIASAFFLFGGVVGTFIS